MGGSTYEEIRNAYKILVGKPEWKRLLGRPRPRWHIIFKVNFRAMVWLPS
jgi:hypothetical protein